MDRGFALFITLVAGALVAFQPPANALLARHVGDLGAAFLSLVLSTLIVGVALVIAGQTGDLAQITRYRPEYALGGVAGAAIVVASLVAVRPLGAGGVAAALVSTQLIFSAFADRLGILGLEGRALSAPRLAGIALLIAGAVLVTSR